MISRTNSSLDSSAVHLIQVPTACTAYVQDLYRNHVCREKRPFSKRTISHSSANVASTYGGYRSRSWFCVALCSQDQARIVILLRVAKADLPPSCPYVYILRNRVPSRKHRRNNVSARFTIAERAPTMAHLPSPSTLPYSHRTTSAMALNGGNQQSNVSTSSLMTYLAPHFLLCLARMTGPVETKMRAQQITYKSLVLRNRFCSCTVPTAQMIGDDLRVRDGYAKRRVLFQLMSFHMYISYISYSACKVAAGT